MDRKKQIELTFEQAQRIIETFEKDVEWRWALATSGDDDVREGFDLIDAGIGKEIFTAFPELHPDEKKEEKRRKGVI